MRLFAVALVLTLLALLLAAQGVRGSEPAEAASAPGVRLVSSSAAGIVLELTLPPDAVRVQSETVRGEEYTTVSVADWSTVADPGAPMLPVASAALGVPFGAGLTLCVLPGRSHRIALGADVRPEEAISVEVEAESFPAASGLPEPHELIVPHAEIYGSSEAFPGVLANVVSDGVLRQQRIVGLAAYPVQYYPRARQLEVYESLRIEVRFDPAGESTFGRAPEESDGIERLLEQGLLNAESAAQWRRQSALPETSEGVPWAPPEPGYKIGVEQEGMVQVTYAALAAAGAPVDQIDPRTFQMYVGGEQVAIYVAGESDGRFDPSDYLLFYGTKIQSKYTSTNIYWLTYGHGQGARMSSSDGTPSSETVPAAYGESLHLEQNKFYVAALPGGEDLERFMWSYVRPPNTPTWSYTLSLPSPYSGSGGMATLRVAMFGYLSNAINPDHHTRLYVNGNLVEDAWWDGITWRYAEVEFPQAYLVPGDNSITLSCPNDTGVGNDIVEIDWLELDFANGFVAANDTLSFSYDTPGDWKYAIDGFSTDALTVFDITDSRDVRRIVGGSVLPSTTGYLLQFRDAIGGRSRYVAASQSAYLVPASIEADTPSNLRSTLNGADYIIITHPAFAATLESLRDYRASQGLRAVQVDVSDVYDEFGYGVVGVQAIRGFLLYAYEHWRAPAPTYVLLVGDGHYDPKNYLEYGRPSYMPPYLATADPWLNETASDNRYVTLTPGDTFPDMIIGRFPVNTTDEANAMVSKVLSYEQSPDPGDWNRGLLFVADNADDGGDFAAASDTTIACCVPDPYQVEKVYLQVTHDSPSVARQAIINGINAGKLIVHYVGHASNNVWAGESLFSTVDIGSLANATKLPLSLPMTCYDGYFIYPYVSSGHSMGESLVRASGKGAVASWSPTGLGIQAGHDQLDRGFLSSIFSGSARDLGEATMAGKLRLWGYGSYLDLLDTYLLLGDPALRLNLLEADLGIEKSVEPSIALQPNDILTYTLAVANHGPDLAFHVVIADELPAFVADAAVVATSLDLNVRPGAPFSWDVQNLNPGEGGTITIRGRVDGAAGVGWYENRARVSAGNREVGATPNEDSALSLVVAGPPGLVQVTANPAQTSVGGQAALEATVTDSWGNAVEDGTLVSFATNLGSTSPVTAPTLGGKAAVTFLAGTVAGEASITASAGDASATTTVWVQPGQPHALSLTATPESISLDATSRLEAQVTDQYGNPVKDGTLVSFTSTLGTLDPLATSTSGGAAISILHGGSQPGLATITALAGSASGAVQVTIGEGVPTEIALTALPGQVVADGVSTSTITALVLDVSGQPITETIAISFTTTLGQLDAPSGWVVAGQAVSHLSGTQRGVATVTAQAGGTSAAVTVEFLPGPAALLTLHALPASIPANGESQSAIAAVVSDAFGNAVADGTLVAFGTNLGATAPPSAATQGGQANTVLTAGTKAGTALVTALAGAASGSVQVALEPGAASALDLSVEPEVLPADGSSTALVSASVTDLFGNYVADGTLVHFSSSLGSVAPPASATEGGVATTTFKAGLSLGLVQVSAWSGGAAGQAEIALVPGAVAYLLVTANPDSIVANGQSISEIRTHALDAWGHDVADGTPLWLATTLGSISPSTGATTSGWFAATLQAGTEGGTAVITARNGDVVGTASVEFRSGALYLPLILRAWNSPVTGAGNSGTGP